MDAVILVGGKGTRLATVVNDVPKPMAPVHGRPFLDYVLEFLYASGKVTRIILATGHLAEKIEQHYGQSWRGVPVVYSRETVALGTGGALLLAHRNCSLTTPFLLLNGDSFVDADLDAMQQLHQTSAAGLTLALYRVDDAARFGTVQMASGKVSAFVEKSGLAESGLINSGVYMVDPLALTTWQLENTGVATEMNVKANVDANANTAVSLETQIIPAQIERGRVHALVTGSRFIDIGLPQTYHAALDFFRSDV